MSKNQSSSPSCIEMSPTARDAANRIFEKENLKLWRKTDRIFALMMVVQWIGGIIAAYFISPVTFVGNRPSINPHLLMAIFLGFAIGSLPVILAIRYPGRRFTRHTIAVAQMLFGALLIDISGGRIETHFHVFGSLAFLAYYRDWPVLITASAITLAYHLVGEHFFPTAIYGHELVSIWTVVEHAGWVLYIDIFLVYMGIESMNNSRQLAERQAVAKEDATWMELQAEELKRTRDQALESTEIKSSFLANMSHEIRTPMNGIIGMAALLEDTELNLEQQDYARTILDSAETLLTIINDVLDFSKIEAGKMTIEVVPMKVPQIVHQVQDLLGKKASEKNLDFICKVPENEGIVLLGDPTRLRQVIWNLVGNAIKFTERGSVTLSVDYGKETFDRVEVNISISDTGIGIPPERQANIFDSFTQADNSTSRKYGGTGLGLTISRQLTQMLGGTMTLTSEVGKGSIFTVHLMLLKADYEEEIVISDAAILVGRHILIVDDNSTNRLILREQLQRWGCTTEQAIDGFEALNMLKSSVHSGGFDLVIVDMQMPGMTGLDMIREVHALPELNMAKFIVLSSSGESISEADKRVLPISGMLEKPARQSDLLNVLLNYFSGIPTASRIAKVLPRELVEESNENPSLGLRILLAEDNLVNQKVAVKTLSKFNCTVTVANNGLEALGALTEARFDIVLMDVQMPLMTGTEATSIIRQLERRDGRHQPIVAMTAHTMEGDRERLLRGGMNDYVSKPFQRESLVRVLRRWHHQLEDAGYLQDTEPILSKKDLTQAIQEWESTKAA